MQSSRWPAAASSPRQVARSFGISESCLARWLAIADRDEGRSSPSTTSAPTDDAECASRSRMRVNRWVSVGLGWHLIPVKGTSATALWQDGATGGFASYASVVPDGDASVVVVTNTSRPVDRLGARLLERVVAATARPAAGPTATS